MCLILKTDENSSKNTNTETSLQLSENTTLFVVCRIYTGQSQSLPPKSSSQRQPLDTMHKLYTSDHDYVTLGTKSTVAQQTTAGSWVPAISEIRPTGEVGFDTIDISRLGSSCP
jgi:hypothetical protein